MPCTSGLNQKNQRIVIGWKQKLIQCCVFYKFQIWLVLGNSVIKLPDACHQWGQIYQSYLFQSLSQFTTILNLESHMTIKYRIRYLPRSFMPSVPCILHCSAGIPIFFFWKSQQPFSSSLKACASSIVIILYIQL